jgi:hypothetical protein
MIRKIKSIEGIKRLNSEELKSVKGGYCQTCYTFPHLPCVMPNGCTVPYNNNGDCWPYTTCGGEV